MPNDVVTLMPEQAWESLVCEGIIYVLSLNDALMSFLTAIPPITRQNPESPNTFNTAYRVQVWHEVQQYEIQPQAGDFIGTIGTFAIGLIMPKDDRPLFPGDLSPNDYLTHMQKLLELGYDGDGEGKLRNPLAAEDETDPVELHLNRKKPEFRLGSKRAVGGSTSLTLWPLLARYQGRLTRTTRRLSS